MITCKLEGGLANQLFIISHIFIYAKRYNLDYCIPTTVNNPHIPGKGAYIFPGVKYCDSPPDLPVYKEKFFHYEEIQKVDNVCFEGYWQSWRYMDGYRDEILKAFGFEWKHKPNMCSIHVRRNDYLKWADYHPPVTEEYLMQAIKMVVEKTEGRVKFKFFSDDLNYCRMFGDKIFLFSESAVEYSEGKNEIEDMAEASGCKYNISSNSAFSWWIHYLNRNKNKVGIFPRRWFGPSLNHNTSDLYLSNSIIL